MAAKSPRRSWTFRFIRNALLLLIPVALVWTLLTPFYNRLLLGTAKNLVRLAESPDVTDLLPPATTTSPTSRAGISRPHAAWSTPSG
jgi:hypothetical protein